MIKDNSSISTIKLCFLLSDPSLIIPLPCHSATLLLTSLCEFCSRLVKSRNLSKSHANSPKVTQPLKKSRNLYTSHATSSKVTKPLQKSCNLSKSHATSPKEYATSQKVTQPLKKSHNLSLCYLSSPKAVSVLELIGYQCMFTKSCNIDL